LVAEGLACGAWAPESKQSRDGAGADRFTQRFTVVDWSEAIEGRKAARAATIETRRSELPDDLAALGTLASKAQDREAAIAINMAILEQTPVDVVALNRLGRAFEATGSIVEAIRTFTVARLGPARVI
jgi:hypothetical protein